jgi:hypothetical protein
MEILNKLTALSESLGMGKEKVEEVKSDVEAFGQIKFDEGKALGLEEGKALGLVEGEAIGYQKGFEAGVASVGGEVTPPSDKIYSEAELAVKIQEAKDLYLVELEAKYDAALQQEATDLKVAIFKKPVV